ncbi:acyl-homoserine-lactone synthase [Enterovibrio norvegicus]|uniref:acyl-homoserine-lactone synthase n=1 Tax=Enterovibrio norvegicus TaxID=188144 RepID=UPI00352F935D
MTIECITVSTLHNFRGNPLAEQFQLRYRSLIERQSWDVPYVNCMEYDQYDNPATVYFVWREYGKVKGVARLYPTTRPYMLKEVFPHLVSYEPLPSEPNIWEGSRFCLDKDLAPVQRKRVIQELVIAYLEYCLLHGITSIVGLMVPAYWKSVFINNGCPISWLGEYSVAGDGKKIRAGKLIINKEVLNSAKNKAGIFDNVLSFGEEHVMLQCS